MRGTATPGSAMAECVLCNEPIWSFICADCIGAGMRSWLAPALVPRFEQFHASLASICTETELQCVRCGEQKPAALDWYCTMNELAQWLLHEDPARGEQLLRMLPLKDSVTSELHGARLRASARPLTEGDALLERREFGLCDECGEYNDELHSIASEWVCSRCLAAE